MSTVCPVHQLPWYLQPAGVSQKTGRPYNAFLRCQVRGCQEKPPRQGPQATPTLAATPFVAPPRSPKDARWAACLSFAGTLYRGSGSEMLEEVLTVAKRVYAEWPND